MDFVTEIQGKNCSRYDKRKLCSFDMEFIDLPTYPIIHQASRFLFIKKGEGTILIDGISYPIRENSLIAILPWEITEIESVARPLQFVRIIYNIDYISQAMKCGANPSNDMIAVTGPLEKNHVIQCTSKEADVILKVLDEIRDEVGVESNLDIPEEQSLSKLYVTNKLIELVIHFQRFANKKECKMKSNQEIELDHRYKIFKYLYSHFSEKLTLSKLSGFFYMSESAISKYIYDVTGLSFTALLNEMRIVKSLDLLIYTGMSLSEIAELTGFADASHLSKVYNERIGTTPNEYRKIYRNIHQVINDKELSLSYQVLNYMYNNYKENLKIQEVADKFNIPLVELNLILLFQVEMNFEDFLNYLRINKSCELLLSTDLAIVDIGIAVGYNNSKTFHRNFVKQKNMTPGIFRKSVTMPTSTVEDSVEFIRATIS